jgi:SAM-dependent methyltransferase
MSLRTYLIEPDLRGVDLEGPERIKKHLHILKKKKIIREVFSEFYDLCASLDRKFFGETSGHRVELGSGVSFFNSKYSDIYLTDIKPAEHLDAVVDAQRLPFRDQSIRCLFGMNCFHHFPDPHAFFSNISKVLVPGGGCVLIEPYFGPFSALTHRRLFATEYFNKDEKSWISNQRETMLGANQALSYIVFFRDRHHFYQHYPELEIVYTQTIDNYIRYLLSGGLNFRQLVPTSMVYLLRKVESWLAPVVRFFALHHVVVIRYKGI